MSGVGIGHSHAIQYGLQKVPGDGARGPSVAGSCWARLVRRRLLESFDCGSKSSSKAMAIKWFGAHLQCVSGRCG